MNYEEETEYLTSYYRCIDPIENFKIRVFLKPVKSSYIPLPQFETKKASPNASHYEETQIEEEDYTFSWQEKVINEESLKRKSSAQNKTKKKDKKHSKVSTNSAENSITYPKKLFSYIHSDNYLMSQKNCTMFTSDNVHILSNSKFNELKISDQNVKNFKSISKTKIINYNPSKDFKSQAHVIHKNLQNMFLMANLSPRDKSKDDNEIEKNDEYILCVLKYNLSNNVLEITPSFSKAKHKPYLLNIDSHSGKKSYYYWLYHASSDISVENLTSEIKIMSKVFDHQDELRKLQIDTNFSVGQQNNLYITLLGEIISAQDFEYNPLYIHYLIKLPPGWQYNDKDLFSGTTQTSHRNSEGICHFSYLFEMNFYINFKIIKDFSFSPPELFFEVLSIDKYNRYRNEGYSFITVPNCSGIFNYSLTCWRALSKTVRSQLERYFIGGGPELEDISYVGLSTNERDDVMSRFGFETIPSGQLNVKLSILRQAECLRIKKNVEHESKINAFNTINTGSLIGSVNTVLEAFRKAKQRMFEAKKGLETDSNGLLKFKNEL